MSQTAQVESIDALRVFRVALLKFAEAANVALGDAESEVQRVQQWLENEQTSHWQTQIRKRTELVSRAKEALRMKKVFKDPTGAKQSYIDEEKALAKAKRLLEEAEQKMAAVKSWSRRYPKEVDGFKGSVQRLSTLVLSDLPTAATKLDRMTAALEAYVAFVAPATGGIALVASSSSEPGAAPLVETAAKPVETATPASEAALPPHEAVAGDSIDPVPTDRPTKAE